jgi:ABC-type multidrug transport system permease subunit
MGVNIMTNKVKKAWKELKIWWAWWAFWVMFAVLLYFALVTFAEKGL